MKNTFNKVLAALILIFMLSGVFAGCVSGRAQTSSQTATSSRADSYADVFKLVKANSSSRNVYRYGGDLIVEEAGDYARNFDLAESAPAVADAGIAGAPKGAGNGASPDYTGTNLQHADVDEADIVKTDGRYIYSLNASSGYLTVSEVTPEGIGKTVKMSIFNFHYYGYYIQPYYYGAVKNYTDSGLSDALTDRDQLMKGVDGVSPMEMYLSGDRLIIIGREETCIFDQELYDSYKNEMSEKAKKYYDQLDPSTRGTFEEYLDHFVSDVDLDGDGAPDNDVDLRRFCSVQDGRGRVMAFVFDVSDPFSPAFVSKCGTDGYYVSSRLTGGKLYIVTNQYYYSPVEDDAATFVPKVWEEGSFEVVPASDIVMKEGTGSFSYFTVAGVDPGSGKLIDVISILGGGDGVYSAPTDMFVYGWSNSGYKSYLGGLYSSWGNYTDVTRIDLTGDKLRVAAETTFEGSPVNQFSFDWYNGYLRVVAKRNSGSYSAVDGLLDRAGLSDEEAVEARYVDDTALYVFDGDLNQIGILEDCGRGETLRSVRFDGEVGYFVTFRNTDPLFAVDLSDPAAPKLLSALKIPGFSTYMHPYGEGLMFGFGNDADIESGGARGIKLSMFDVSDKTDVRECAKFIFKDVAYSPASYNHKAILVSAEKNLIGFVGGDGVYSLFGYDPENGFFERAEISVGSYWYDDARGIYIDGLFWVVSSGAMTVMDLEKAEVVSELDFGTVDATLIFKDGAVSEV
ncbi:MAG: beta-propeller domain-containing protein [Clostridia bacterium]|nr:beta-propeller domain-containing protein [Clostridia bacterium]